MTCDICGKPKEFPDQICTNCLGNYEKRLKHSAHAIESLIDDALDPRSVRHNCINDAEIDILRFAVDELKARM